MSYRMEDVDTSFFSDLAYRSNWPTTKVNMEGKKREYKIDGWMVGYACRVQPCNGQTSGEAKLEIEHCVPTLQPMYINHLKIRGLEPQYTHKCIKFDI